MNHFKFLKVVTLSTALFASAAFADTVAELTQKAKDAAAVLEAVSSIPDRGIPTSLLSKATCVATIPNVIRAGFVFGARYGKGLVSCRTASGGWSQPAFITVKGGSWGFQIGVESIDLVLVFTKDNAIDHFSHDNFTVGADASVTAGPLGRDAQAGTDYQLNSEIYSYSKSKGLFAGLAVEGSVIDNQVADDQAIYGMNMTAHDILTAEGQTTVSAGSPYVNALRTLAP